MFFENLCKVACGLDYGRVSFAQHYIYFWAKNDNAVPSFIKTKMISLKRLFFLRIWPRHLTKGDLNIYTTQKLSWSSYCMNMNIFRCKLISTARICFLHVDDKRGDAEQ